MRQLSTWEKESFFCRQHVIIVGSGFCGLWSALHLKRLHPHYKITVLERGLIPTGASTRNAGFSCFGSPTELINDAAVMGEDMMWELVRMRYNGLREITQHFNNEETGYEPTGGYECFVKDSEDWMECAAKLSWLNKGLEKISGDPNVFRPADDKLSLFGLGKFDRLVENKMEGCLHPGKLVRALLKKVQSMDVQVLTGIEVIGYEESVGLVHIRTDQEVELVAEQLLICTNAFTQQLIPTIDIVPNRGQVLVTAPVEGLTLKGAFHFNRGYYYFRNLGNRILLGGARHIAFEAETSMEMFTTDAIQNELENFMGRYLLPGLPFTVTDRWTGIMAMGSVKSPIVKQISDHVFCCVRMSGIGVALAPVVAKQVAMMMRD